MKGTTTSGTTPGLEPTYPSSWRAAVLRVTATRTIANDISPPVDRPTHLVQRALDAERTIDFRFYARAASQALADLASQTATSLYPRLVRQVAASFSVDKRGLCRARHGR